MPINFNEQLTRNQRFPAQERGPGAVESADTSMCLRDTGVGPRSLPARNKSRRARVSRGTVVLLAVSMGIAVCAQAQIPGTAPLTISSAETALETGVRDGHRCRRLAGAASGPVAAVWYAAGTGRLLVKTESSRVFETATTLFTGV